jgi:plasmid stabilization system protein ParE
VPLELSRRAARAVAQLRRYYEQKGRPEASDNLLFALERASERIAREPEMGLIAPRPYPEVAHAGERLIKEGRYWIAYSLTIPPVILAVVYDQADLPRLI